MFQERVFFIPMCCARYICRSPKRPKARCFPIDMHTYIVYGYICILGLYLLLYLVDTYMYNRSNLNITEYISAYLGRLNSADKASLVR